MKKGVTMFEQLKIGDDDKIGYELDILVNRAIDRLKYFEPEEGYYLADSGGKDSCVIRQLAIMAGVKYDSHYAITTVDPPELLRFIKKYHPETERHAPEINMYDLIVKKKCHQHELLDIVVLH